MVRLSWLGVAWNAPRGLPIPALTGLDVRQLCWSNHHTYLLIYLQKNSSITDKPRDDAFVQTQRRGWPIKRMISSRMYYRAELGSSTSTGLYISRANLPKLGSDGDRSLGCGPLELCPSPTRVTVPNLVVLRQPYERNYRGRSTWKFRLSRTLEVIRTDTDRSATYDFLLTFPTATMSLSRTVSE